MLKNWKDSSKDSHVASRSSLLKSVHLSMTDVVIIICQSLLSDSNVSPTTLADSVIFSVKRQRRCERKRQGFPNGTRVKFSVDIEREGGKRIRRSAAQARNAVILLRIDRGDREGVFEELGIRHGYGGRMGVKRSKKNVAGSVPCEMDYAPRDISGEQQRRRGSRSAKRLS